MSITPTIAVSAFRRRVTGSAFVAAALKATLCLAVIWAVTLLVVRLCGGHLPPAWWWFAFLAPVVVWGWIAARRDRLSAAAAAAHLDRRLGLDGLLLCADQFSADRSVPLDPQWQDRLEHGLDQLPVALPRTRWRSILPLPLCALGLAVLTAALPPPPPIEHERKLPTFEAEVGRLGSELRDLFDRGHVPDEVEEELRRKHAELEQKVDAGEMPEWRDFDELDQRITREQLMQLAAAGENRAASDGKGDSGESKGRSLESLAMVAKALAELGLLDNLPAQFSAALQAVRQADGSFALDKLPFDPAQLQALAESFAAAMGDFGELGLDAGTVASLEALLEGFAEGPGQGQGEGAGRGGQMRGPGHAALSLTESSPGGADKAMPLPQGRGLPHEWVPIGSERITPVVAPQNNNAAGTAGVEGTGGATWQLEYAPRHRAVLRKFFGKAGK